MATAEPEPLHRVTSPGRAPGSAAPHEHLPRALPVLGSVVLLAGAAYVGAVDPARGGAYLACPVHRMTGLWCPGCGMTRAFHHLLTGDVAGALSTNALLPLVVALGGYLWLAWLWPSLTGRRLTALNRVPTAVWTALVVLAVGFGILRNLPVAPFASLAP